MASSFGGTIKLTGESEYRSALKNINSNLKEVSSAIKLVSSEFVNNGSKLGDLRSKNEALSNKLKEEQQVIKTCTSAVKDFTEQQEKSKNEIDKLKSSLELEKTKLEEMKKSTTSTNAEISNQEKLISNLQRELAKSEATYDSNNRKINEYKTTMNLAQIECNSLSKEIEENDKILGKLKYKFADNSKVVKEFADEEDKAGEHSLKLSDIIKGNLISEGIIAGFKGLVGAVKSVSSAFIDVGKSAVSSYADYEQLIGGVETLFKDSAGLVENYANNAYKTSGLSANEYMETVTSFSASLLQSLNNDTAKSAQVADMAIVDMSDNANKMGTSMESIQTAYQGFAKQNYTMLDNLKLGYGGTKSEMERLLKDAQKISGVKYNINNLSDVYNAIHVIQGELGITGTTAKEASTTIQGSLSAVKSSWQNLLTGVADSNADWGTLINNFVSSIVTAGENLIPIISDTVEGIGLLITDALGLLVSQVLPMGKELISSLITGMSEMLPDILKSISNLISILCETIISLLPQIIEMGIQLIVALVQGIAESLPTLIPQMINAVLLIVDTLLNNIDLIIDAGIALLIGLADGLINAIPDLIDRIPIIIESLINAITNNLPKILKAGMDITVKLAGGIVKAIPQLVSKIPQIISAITSTITSGLSAIVDVGKNIVKGLWEGISGSLKWIKDKITGWVGDVFGFIKKLFGINSPSTLFRDEIGVYLAKGIGVGFEEEMANVNNTIQKAIPTNFDISPNVKVNNGSGGNSYGVGSSDINNYENNTYNFYNVKDSPSEYARQMRKERQYLKMVNG